MQAGMARRAGRAGRALLVLGLACGAACGGSDAPKTDQFVGPWTFTSGTLAPTCVGGITVPPFTLVGLTMVLTKVDDSTVSLTAGSAGCTVKFKVSGGTASAEPKQTCTLDVGGALMTQMIVVNSWTLKLAGSDRLDSDIKGAASICSVAGSGVLMRGAPDAGVPDAGGASDGGKDTASEAGAADAATDVTSEAGTTDGGTDTTSEAGPTDAATEAGVTDAATEAGTTDAPAETGTSEGGS
jgi:hypothetical protein